MAEQALGVGLQAVNLGTQHYDKIKDPIQRRVRKARGLDREDPDLHDHRPHDEKGMMLRRRDQVGSDEEIVETVRHRGQVLARRPGRPVRSSSSMDNVRGGYESEGSVPPRGRTRPKSVGGRSKKRGSSSSSSSSSDLGSSTDDNKKVRKMQRKKWLTAALASVATIHAASKVYSSIESHDKRIIQVEKGELSPEEAHKKQKAARWSDAAAIGIAALGIKGALSEWNEVHEEHVHHKEMMQKAEEHHKKRLERIRRDRAKDSHGHGYYKGRDGNWYYEGDEPQDSERKGSSYSRKLDDWDDGGTRNGDMRLTENGGSERGKSRARSSYGRDRDYDRDRDRDRDYSPDDKYRNRSRRRRDDDRY